jgi:hypothetical protein
MKKSKNSRDVFPVRIGNADRIRFAFKFPIMFREFFCLFDALIQVAQGGIGAPLVLDSK